MSASILHIETRHRRGGAERNLNHMAAWQAAAGHRVVIAVGRDSYLEEIREPVEGILVPSLVRPLRPSQDVRAIVNLRNLVRRERFDVVHTHQSKAGVLGRMAARRVTRTVIHTVHMLSFGAGYGRASSEAFRRAEAGCARWTDELIAVGDELRELYLKARIGSPDRFRVIHSPIELDAFTAVRAWTPGDRAAARLALGLETASPLLLVVSALEPRKRLDLLLDRLAGELRNGWQIAIAGEGAQRDALTAQAAALGIRGAVRFLGQRDDVPALMGTADALVHAAEAEGVPQVVVQALAAGLPVVATDVIGLREVEGAPIAIGASDGSDLMELVRRQVEEPPTPVAESALDPWSTPAVEEKIARLHADLGL